MNKKYLGIIQNSQGCYVTSSLEKSESGDFCQPKFLESETITFKDELLWGKHGIAFGIETKYRSKESNLVFEQFDSSESSSGKLTAMGNHEDIIFAKDLLEANLVKITNEDAFLTTIPIHFSDYKTSSFISLYLDAQNTLIAITIDQVQKAVFKYTGENDSGLIGFIGRIKRYWDIKFGRDQFPSTVIFINRNESPAFLKLKPHFINNDWLKMLTLDQFRTLGLSLSQLGDETPIFTKETERAIFRNKRFTLNMLSIAILVVSIFAVGFLFITSKFNDYKLDKLKVDYERIVASDGEIKSLNQRNRELANTILYMESNVSKRTRWAEFLYTIGKGAPKDLFIEKLGSEPVKGSNNQIKIALLGHSSKEISITQFISLLQKTKYTTKVSLISMEKDKKRKDKYRFKIICTLLSQT